MKSKKVKKKTTTQKKPTIKKTTTKKTKSKTGNVNTSMYAYFSDWMSIPQKTRENINTNKPVNKKYHCKTQNKRAKKPTQHWENNYNFLTDEEKFQQKLNKVKAVVSEEERQELSKIKPTKRQQKIIDLICSGENIFLTGEAGTGKSFIVRKAICELTKMDKQVLVCAPTGLAAVNVGGCTIHRLLSLRELPIAVKTNQIRVKSPEVLRAADTVIVDEISMCRMDLFDCLIKSIKSCEEISKKKIQIVVVGDFFQLPPIIDSKSGELDILHNYYKKHIIRGYAFEGEMWRACKFTNILLTEVIRQNNIEFIKELNKARYGKSECLSYFSNMSSKTPVEDGIYLSGTNKEVYEINKTKLDAIDGKRIDFTATKTGEEINCLAENILELKVGAKVMFITNDPDGKYFNGTFGKVTKMGDTVEVLTENKEFVEVSEYIWEGIQYIVDEDGKLATQVIGTVKQIPLKLAYAITIHKSQGQTFSKVNLNPRCWDSGQLYCALSRVRSIEELYFTSPLKSEYLITDKLVKNFYENFKLTREERSAV